MLRIVLWSEYWWNIHCTNQIDIVLHIHILIHTIQFHSIQNHIIYISHIPNICMFIIQWFTGFTLPTHQSSLQILNDTSSSSIGNGGNNRFKQQQLMMRNRHQGSSPENFDSDYNSGSHGENLNMHVDHINNNLKGLLDDENRILNNPLNRGPYFDISASKNVTALVGKTAYLNCRIKNLGNKTVSSSSLCYELIIFSNILFTCLLYYKMRGLMSMILPFENISCFDFIARGFI